MIIYADTPVHPLERHGVHQRERLLQALIPGNLRLDERSMQDLIAFVGKFAQQVRFWNEGNEPQGDWGTFWESDNTTLFAIMAAVDLENLRTEYRSKELEYLRLFKMELENPDCPAQDNQPTAASTIRELVVLIYELALKVAGLCRKAPADHPIYAEFQRIVSTKLRTALLELIAFHKGSVAETLLEAYADFIGDAPAARAWGLPTAEDFLCIDYVSPDECREELWQLFLRFYQALALMVDKASRAFRSALRSRDDHAPHITLFLTFLHLFRHLQDEMNRLPERHLLFYYHDVLRLQQRRAIPDKVHLVFELAQNITRYRLKEDTLFAGGTDQGGKLRVYGLEDEVVVGQVKLVEKKNLYYEEKEDKSIFSIALSAADKRDGVEEAFAPGLKVWNAFSGKEVYNRIDYKLLRIKELYIDQLPPNVEKERNFWQTKKDGLQGFSGFLISSPELWLEGGELRKIEITLGVKDKNGQTLNINKVELLSVEGWVNLEVVNLPDNGYGSDSQPLYGKAAVYGNHKLVIYLSANFPSIIYEPTTAIPLLKIGIKNQTPQTLVNVVKINTARGRSSILTSYDEINTVSFLVNKTPIKPNIELYVNENGRFVKQESLILTTATNVYVKFEEIFRKTLQNISVTVQGDLNNWNWNLKDNPIQIMIDVGFKNIYELTDTKPASEPSNSFNEGDTGIIKIHFSPPRVRNPSPIVITSENIKITYTSDVADAERINYYTTFGEWPTGSSKNGFNLLPNIRQPSTSGLISSAGTDEAPPQPAHGNLFLGFESLVPGQTLNLLFKTAEGTGNPDHIAPDVAWSYLRDNDWVRFPPKFILKDETLGMKQTGITRFQIPDDINNGNTWIKGKEDRMDLFWLRASATEFPDDKILVDALPMLVDIHVNAGTAVFKNDDNTTEHLEPGLPAETIAALRFRDVNVKRVEQPYASFGGRLSEDGDRHSYYRRIHERLRHRQRAITVWDYERLVLEQFPKVALAKCLPHTQVVAAGMPGHVTLAAVPYPDKMVGNRKYYPNLDAGDLEAMRQYLNRHNSYFVGGHGSPGFCCCHEEKGHSDAHDCHCGCSHGKSKLSVINARFEPIRLQVCVRFYAGRDIPFYTKQLNEDLKTFLAPWANDQHKPLQFGTSISTTNLLLFLENLDYVDVVMNLKVKHFASRTSADYGESELPWSAPETIVPFTAASLLTTYLNRLDEDNPNVLDHEINVISEQDGCACKTCLLEKLRLQIEAEWRKVSTHTCSALQIFIKDKLDAMVDHGNLMGEVQCSLPCLPPTITPPIFPGNDKAYYGSITGDTVTLYLAIYSLERLESVTINKPKC